MSAAAAKSLQSCPTLCDTTDRATPKPSSIPDETASNSNMSGLTEDELCPLLIYKWVFPDGSGGKEMPTMWETWVRSLGREDPLEKEMATHFSILAWRIPWTEEPGTLQSMGSQRVGQD